MAQFAYFNFNSHSSMAASNYSLSPSQLAMPIPEDYKKALDEALVSINTQNYQLRRSMVRHELSIVTFR
jgi:hypothetical protein